jgi:hypothetical protein
LIAWRIGGGALLEQAGATRSSFRSARRTLITRRGHRQEPVGRGDHEILTERRQSRAGAAEA